jgi:hypothetical protein
MNTVKSITFIPNAELAEPHDCCAACDAEWPVRCLTAIKSEEVYARYTRHYSLNRDDGVCPECHEAINADYDYGDGSDEAYENRFDR